MSARPGLPMVVAAPSGTGKTTVCRQVVERDGEIVFSVSHTTRPRRAGERDGEDYHFVSEAEFLALVQEEAFLEHASEWARRPDAHGTLPLGDPRVRERLAQAAVNAEVAKLLRHRATWLQAEGEAMGARGAMAKAFSAEAYLADSIAWMELLGPLGLLERGEASCPGNGLFVETFRASPVTTIYGGTLEILRSLIAEETLGLPRSR